MEIVSINVHPKWDAECRRNQWDPNDGNFATNRAYSLTKDEVEILGTAMYEVNRAVRLAVAALLHDDLALDRMAIPEWVRPHLRRDWEMREHRPIDGLMVRADFSMVNGVPVLLDYNADCQGDLIEAAYKQATIAEVIGSDVCQQNDVTDALLTALGKLEGKVLHVAYEDEGGEQYTAEIIAELAEMAGVEVERLNVSDIEYGGGAFWGNDRKIENLYMAYPLEAAIQDEFGKHLAESTDLLLLEPLWKYLTTSKGFLAELYRLYPDHPNLLPTYYEENAAPLGTSYVRKPLFGWSGGNVQVVKDGQVMDEVEGPFANNLLGGSGRFIRQQYAPVPKLNFDGTEYRPMFGAFSVEDIARTLVIREMADRDLTEAGEETVVPHFIAA